MTARDVSPITRLRADLDTRALRRAFRFAAEAHRGRRRETGDPAFAHPLNVARILALTGADEIMTIAGILHDTVEDTDVTIAELRRLFGPSVSDLVALLTKPCKGAQPPVMSLTNGTVWSASRLRAVRIKIADRLDNMFTVHALPVARRTRLARESLNYICPVADDLDPIAAIALRRLSWDALKMPPSAGDLVPGRAKSRYLENSSLLTRHVSRSTARTV